MNNDDLLYHYTTADGLLGMLGVNGRKAALWMTQIQYMNDEDEYFHSVNIVSKAGEALYGEVFGSEEDRRIWPFVRCFVFSLSEKKDLLSQWRGYAPKGGYCLGFRYGDLSAFAHENDFYLQKCLYNDEKLLFELETFKADDIPSLQSGDFDRLQAGKRYVKAYENIHPTIKNASFQEEQEWRIFGPVSTGDPRARYRARGSEVVPYCEIDISSSGNCHLPIREITVGPGVDFYAAKHALDAISESLAIRPALHKTFSSLRTR